MHMLVLHWCSFYEDIYWRLFNVFPSFFVLDSIETKWRGNLNWTSQMISTMSQMICQDTKTKKILEMTWSHWEMIWVILTFLSFVVSQNCFNRRDLWDVVEISSGGQEETHTRLFHIRLSPSVTDCPRCRPNTFVNKKITICCPCFLSRVFEV